MGLTNQKLINTSRQKISRKVLTLNNTLDQMDLTDIQRLSNAKTADCTLQVYMKHSPG